MPAKAANSIPGLAETKPGVRMAGAACTLERPIQLPLRLFPFQRPSSTPCAAFASSVCMWGADLQDNTYIQMPVGCSSGPWWKFSPLSGVGLSLRCVLRVVFTETYQTGRCPLPWSHAGCWASEVGPSVHIPTSWSLTRLPDVQPQAHSRSVVFSVTFVGVGYTRCFCLPVTSTAGDAVLPHGVPPHGTAGGRPEPAGESWGVSGTPRGRHRRARPPRPGAAALPTRRPRLAAPGGPGVPRGAPARRREERWAPCEQLAAGSGPRGRQMG